MALSCVSTFIIDVGRQQRHTAPSVVTTRPLALLTAVAVLNRRPTRSLHTTFARFLLPHRVFLVSFSFCAAKGWSGPEPGQRVPAGVVRERHLHHQGGHARGMRGEPGRRQAHARAQAQEQVRG